MAAQRSREILGQLEIPARPGGGTSALGIIDWHIHEGRVECSQGIWDALGYADAARAGQLPDWDALIHPTDRDGVKRTRAELLAGRIAWTHAEYRVRRRGGGWAWIRAALAVAERDAQGAPCRAHGVASEISREREMRQRFRAMFDQPDHLFGLLSREGRLLEVNSALLGLAGSETAGSLGELIREIPLLNSSSAASARLRASVGRAACGETVRLELPIVVTSGESRTLDLTLIPLQDDDGFVADIVLEGRDISASVAAMQALGEAESRLAIATRSANIALWDWNPTTDAAWFNTEWYAMLGFLPGEVPACGASLLDLVHPEDRDAAIGSMRQLVRERSVGHRIEYRMRHRDGRWRWILTQGSVVERRADGWVVRVAGVQIDVTEQRELESQLATARRLESIGQLASGIAHEINTPIQYVSDSLHFIRDGVRELLALVAPDVSAAPARVAGESTGLGFLREQLPDALERALEGLDRVTAIVRSMKGFAHPGLQSMHPTDINSGLLSTLELARHEYKYVADLTTELAKLPPVVCYAGEINQVVLNLIVNAAHAIADVVGSSGRRGRIHVCSRQEDEDVLVGITDDGGGIPESIRHRIFEPFFTTKDVGRGTGQGLAVAQHVIVQRHGGELSFQTEVGVGTTFLLRLPVRGSTPLAGVHAV
jgi:PAS domain S-box-containing protein